MSRNGTSLPQLVPDRVRGTGRRILSRIWNEEPAPVSVTGSAVFPTLPEDPARWTAECLPVENREEFGSPGSAFEYRLFRVHVPAGPVTSERYLFWDCDGEATVYLDGQPWAGLDVAHRYCPIPEGERDLLITVGTYQQGIWVGEPLSPESRCRFRRAYTAGRSREMWDLYWDFEVLRQLMDHHLSRVLGTERDGEGYHPPLRRAPAALRRLLARLDAFCDAFDLGDVARAQRILTDTYAEYSGSATDGSVALVGHSHLDLVWLWPERVTYEKIVHTVATTLRLAERYPELKYSQSTPHLYHELAERAPGLMDQVRGLMEDGRWEATGGLYVEADVNLPSGEGLARSLLFGQRGFEALTGGLSSTLWLPDVFGYPGCLPQLMRLAGIDSFFTTKLSWSAVTNFPYNAFSWSSADGSTVTACLSPVGYCDPVTVETVGNCIELNQQTGVHDTVLMPMGYGDGGGGVTEEMLESARRLRSLAGVPGVSWTTAEEHFAGLARIADELPRFEGELYLEFHRGTLTTQSRFKSRYRACERAMQLREAVRAVVGLEPLTIDHWRRLLFAQFHDALPGSSIPVVYEELEPELSSLTEDTVSIAGAELAAGLGHETIEGTNSAGGLWVFNPIAITRSIAVDNQDGGDTGGGIARCTGVGLFPVTPAEDQAGGFREVSARVLDNGIVRAEFTDHGSLSGLSVRGRTLRIRDCEFLLCADLPAKYDAWDIDYPAGDLSRPVLGKLNLAVAQETPLRATLEGKSELGDGSHATVRYELHAGGDHLLVELDIDWGETHRLLQYSVKTSYTGRDAVFGEPFGAVRRSQKPGLPAQVAQWEVAGQRWAAVSNDSLSEGLAIVTESKYGFSCKDGDLRVSLLRAPVEPDPGADKGKHHIRFAVGEYRTNTDDLACSTAAAAEALYADFTMVRREATTTGGSDLEGAVISFSDLGSLTPSWVKPAEDGNGVVLRLHECAGNHGQATLTISRRLLGDAAPQLIPVDLLERPVGNSTLGPAGDDEDGVRYSIPYGPHQIVTLKVPNRESGRPG